MKLAAWTPLSILVIALIWAGTAPDARTADASFNQAAQRAVSSPPTSATAVFAGFTDGILGNRARMVQVACIFFAIGVFILVTSTRKH